MDINKIYNEDCQEGVKRISDASIDCILTDPPYLYLKGQKLERPFNEKELFTEFKRILKPTGFVVLFGRGTSFYRWNTILSDLGLEFKEEIVWDKKYSTSPLMRLSRIHETISFYTKKNGVILKTKVPYLEMKRYDLDSILQDMNRLKCVLKNPTSLNNVLEFIENNRKFIDKKYVDKYTVSIQTGVNQVDRSTAVLSAIENGMNEKSIIRCDYTKVNRPNNAAVRHDAPTGDRNVDVIQCISCGMNEKSIIREGRDHYKTIHPTQKPVRLLERLLALVTRPGDVVLDPFSGSGSTAVACINNGRKFIGFEIDKEYYDASVERLKKALSEPKLAM